MCLAFLLLFTVGVSEELAPADETQPETCSVQRSEQHFCEQRNMLRHEIRYYDQKPSFCYYGEIDKFIPRFDEEVGRKRTKVTFVVKKCGWTGLKEYECKASGCCWRLGVCYEPLRPAEVETSYHQRYVTFPTAAKTCRAEKKSLFCVQHEDDLKFVARASCGVTWLAGQIETDKEDDVFRYKVTYRDDTHEGTCNKPNKAKKKLTCERNNADKALSYGRHNDKYHIVNANSSDKRNLLCAQEIWTPFLEKFPAHIEVNEAANFSCSLREMDVDGKSIMSATLTWVIRNTKDEKISETTMHGTTESTIAPQQPGRYECVIELSLTPGVLGTHAGSNIIVKAYAYYYIRTSVEVTIIVQSPAEKTPRINELVTSNDTVYDVLLNDNITLKTRFTGYPHPNITITSAIYPPLPTNTSGSNTTHTEPVINPVRWVEVEPRVWEYASFGNSIWPYGDYDEVTTLSFESLVPHGLEPYNITLKKAYIVQQTDIPPPPTEVDVGEAVTLQCYGYGVGSLHEVTATWRLNGYSFEEQRVRSVERERGMVQIVPTSAQYSGDYECQLENGSPGKITHTYPIRVRAPPPRPEPAELEQTPSELTIRFPRSHDLWEQRSYNVCISHDSLPNQNIVFNATTSEGDVKSLTNIYDAANQTKPQPIAEYSAILTYTVSLELDDGDVVNLTYSISLIMDDGIQISLTETPLGAAYSGFYVQYTIANNWGSSDASIKTAPTTEHTIEIEEITTTDVSIRFLIKPDVSGFARNNATYNVIYNDVDSRNESMQLHITGPAITIGGLNKHTKYYYYVEDTTNGSFSKVYTNTTKLVYTLFDADICKPANFTVQQIDNRQRSAVVLVRWNPPPVAVDVIHFTLLVVAYSINTTSQEDGNEPIVNMNVSANARSVLLTDPGLLLDKNKIYHFSLTTTIDGAPIPSTPATAKIALSEARCPVNPPSPSICGALIKDRYKLVFRITDEATGRTSEECYEDKGETYNGTIQRTTSGQSCKNWDQTDSEYADLTSNYCRNPTGSEMSKPWCYLLDNSYETCEIYPCGFYQSNVTFTRRGSSGSRTVTVRGKDGCIHKKTSDERAALESWYGYGADPQCEGISSVYEVPLNESSKFLSQGPSMRTRYAGVQDELWYRYVMLVLACLQLNVIILAIVYSKRRILKKLKVEKKLIRHQASIKQALTF